MPGRPPSGSGQRWPNWQSSCGQSNAWVIAPAVLGPLGVAAGCVAIAKGDKWWGAAGVSGSAVAAVVGYYWAEGLVG